MNTRTETRPKAAAGVSAAGGRHFILSAGHWLKSAVAIAALLLALGAVADEVLPMMKIGTATYSNVTVLSKTPTDVFISFRGGMANLKVRNLSTEVLAQLGYQVDPARDAPQISVAERIQADPRVKEMQAMIAAQVGSELEQLDPEVVWAIVAAMGLGYLFFCYCGMLICRKTGVEPGVLIWVPVLQGFPLLKAAGMPAWWFLWFLVPVLNLVGSIVWCVKIAKARKKSMLTALMLMLPVTNFLAFLYLAFSGSGEEPEAELGFGPIKLA